MFPTLSSIARRFAAGIAVLALVSVLAQFAYLNGQEQESLAETAWSMARYFTILTTLLTAATLGIAAYARDTADAPWLASLTLAEVIVGGVYHVLLSDLTDYRGLGLWADHGLHSAVPVACLFWWLAYAPKRALVYSDLPIFALWPAIYVAYALARGSFDGVYPYPFMDLMALSSGAVAVNLAGLMVLLLLGGVVLISIGRYTDR